MRAIVVSHPIIPFLHKNQSIELHINPGHVCIQNGIPFSGVKYTMILDKEAKAKSQWVLCAMTMSPFSVAVPVAINAEHRFPALDETFSDEPFPYSPYILKNAFHARSVSSEISVPRIFAPWLIPQISSMYSGYFAIKGLRNIRRHRETYSSTVVRNSCLTKNGNKRTTRANSGARRTPWA